MDTINQKEDTSIPQFMVYPPMERAMKDEYPELDEYSEFKGMRTNDLKFAWYYALFYKNLERKARLNSAYLSSWGSQRNEKKDAILSMNFPPDIRGAIKRFENMDVPMRARASMMLDHMVRQMEEIIYEKPVDFEEKEKYIKMVKVVQEMLPAIIKDKESAYGVRMVTPKEVINGRSFVDQWQKNKIEVNANDGR